MRMQVSEHDNEVFIELSGVAGRHQEILQALTDGHIAMSADPGEATLSAADVSVRAGADEMHIRLKGRSGHHFEALCVYHYLRHVLIERDARETDGAAYATRGAMTA